MSQACQLCHFVETLDHIVTGESFPLIFFAKQVSIELFSSFEEDPMRPVTEAMIQIRNQHVEVYKVALRIHAHFTGLRYFVSCSQ